MVCKAACLWGIIMMSVLGAAAQEDTSKVDVFGGYSYFDRAHGLGAVNLNGWEAQGTYNFNRWLGATADFGGYYARPGPSIDFNEYTFLFGPTVRPAHATHQPVSPRSVRRLQSLRWCIPKRTQPDAVHLRSRRGSRHPGERKVGHSSDPA